MFGISEFHRIQFLTIGWRVLRIHTPDSGENHHHDEYHFEFSLPSNIFRWLEIGLVHGCAIWVWILLSEFSCLTYRRACCLVTVWFHLDLSDNARACLIPLLFFLITRPLVWYRFCLSDNCLITVWYGTGSDGWRARWTLRVSFPDFPWGDDSIPSIYPCSP